jgi:hypothetical protein
VGFGQLVESQDKDVRAKLVENLNRIRHICGGACVRVVRLELSEDQLCIVDIVRYDELAGGGYKFRHWGPAIATAPESSFIKHHRF